MFESEQSSATESALSFRERRPQVLLRVEGTVQGVGFRPFVYRLARRLGVEGWVCNDERGVLIGARAPLGVLARLEKALREEAPPAARVDSVRVEAGGANASAFFPAPGTFVVVESRKPASAETALPPDLAVCSDCLGEMRDPNDRRFRYPFINCTNCGPRYSIVESIPYDRPATTMRHFPLCPECRTEYENPADRRFHAEPVACPECGPRLAFRDRRGVVTAEAEAALQAARERLRAGDILAVKGIGGFHLMCDAANDDALMALRARKHRERKPLALMVSGLSMARDLCELTAPEEALLASSRAPIVLLPRRCDGRLPVSDQVAPDNPLLGLMLPYSPLHHLLMEEGMGPLVATSGNLSEEPICFDEAEVVTRLGRVADAFLVHDRPIARPVDDSVVRFMGGRPVVLRRARGYAPEPVGRVNGALSLVAAGAFLKNTTAVTAGGRIYPSQHIGDLATAAARDAFGATAQLLARLYENRPAAVACDLHPDYPSTHWAEQLGPPVVRVQHHHAHVLSCLAEYDETGTVLGVAWDGTGYGSDGTIWGGEWLIVSPGEPGFRRLASLRPFILPGGEAAIRRPALTAFGLLHGLPAPRNRIESASRRIPGLDKRERAVLERMATRGLNVPVTSSVGRLFDGIAALLGLGREAAFEGQFAMKLEFLAAASEDSARYPFEVSYSRNKDRHPDAPAILVDWRPLVAAVLKEISLEVEASVVARRFHNSLAAMVAAVAKETPDLPVVLTGGCFQNKLLLESTIQLLEADQITVFTHRDIPPNDGGIAVGQILAAASTCIDPLEGTAPSVPPKRRRT